jgi:predicted  nucleic acid-binding Zn-ribbon protein
MSDIDDLIEELKQKRDELRVQMNLASKEVKDEWAELEGKMNEFVARAQIKESRDGIGDALGQVGNELKSGYERIRAALKNGD